MRLRIWTALTLLLATLLVGSSARAQTDGTAQASCPVSPDLAKGAGDQAMLANRHAEALACYEAAYRYAPSPALLYNQARALQFLNQNAEALRRLLQFQRGATPDTLERVPQLPQLIESLRARVGELEILCSVDGAEVLLDERSSGRTPLPEPVLVDPATVRVQVRRQGYAPYESELLVNAGEHRILRVKLDPESRTAPGAATAAPAGSALVPAEPTSTPSGADPGAANGNASASNQSLRVAAWTTLGVGAAGALFAGISYAVASSHLSDVCGGATECSSNSYDADALDSYDTWRGIYTGSLVVAGVGLAGGGVLLWISSTETDSNATGLPGLGVGVVPGGVRVLGRF